MYLLCNVYSTGSILPCIVIILYWRQRIHPVRSLPVFSWPQNLYRNNIFRQNIRIWGEKNVTRNCFGPLNLWNVNFSKTHLVLKSLQNIHYNRTKEIRRPWIEDDLGWKTEDNLGWRTTMDMRQPWMGDNIQFRTTLDARQPWMGEKRERKTTLNGTQTWIEY